MRVRRNPGEHEHGAGASHIPSRAHAESLKFSQTITQERSHVRT